MQQTKNQRGEAFFKLISTRPLAYEDFDCDDDDDSGNNDYADYNDDSGDLDVR